MAGQLYNSSQIDDDGRQFVLDDSILHVHYYSTVGESWDRLGSSGQSWASENFLPNDPFESDSVASDRWGVVDTTTTNTNTIEATGEQISLGIEGDEGVVALSSDGKWRLEGDFDLRLYIDWGSYYNEYRSISSTFLKIGFDGSNAARIAFTFDGVGGYQLRSEKVVGRDLRFFDWRPNGSFASASSFSATDNYLFFRVQREGGVIRTFVSDGVNDTKVGEDIDDSVFSNELFVEFGVEAKEFNTYRTSFNKFFFVAGSITPTTEFFSSARGRRKEFPETSIIVVDDQSLSIIDDENQKLWMRLLFEEGGPVETNQTKVHACNGTVYCTTSDGLVAIDFHRDKIYKYRGSSILVADESIALRNAGVVFRNFATGIGNIANSNLHDVYCRTVAGEDYLAFTHDSGITVIRALASGVANSSDGPLPGAGVEISERGGLYWSGYDPVDNVGQLSFFSNITALASTGTTSFNRTGFYGTDTGISIFGENITSFSVATSNNTDLVAVGTTEGVSFLAFSPGAPFTKSVSFGVQAPADNPFKDPSFEEYLGLEWRPFYTGLHDLFDLRRSSTFAPDGGFGVLLKFRETGSNAKLQPGETLGLYQDVDLTGVERIYFDAKMVGTSGDNPSLNIWNFEVQVGDTVVKSHRDIDGPFTKFNDSANVVDFDGVQRVKFQIRNRNETNAVNTGQRIVYIDNIKTKIGDPDFRVLPPGNASIEEVLLQYDSEGEKVYFSSSEGYGAIDLVDNSLDFFVALSAFGPADSETISADFSRVADEV